MSAKSLKVTLNDELYTQLQDLAARNNISMAAQIRYLISQAVPGRPKLDP
ncbi:hypothetical protein NIES2107_71790 (plasmid) [Nostoc carneum NIES-2107]|nr:hypothetical protein NIES2107_71790 [Nostoc carneum NIES-2107]